MMWTLMTMRRRIEGMRRGGSYYLLSYEGKEKHLLSLASSQVMMKTSAIMNLSRLRSLQQPSQSARCGPAGLPACLLRDADGKWRSSVADLSHYCGINELSCLVPDHMRRGERTTSTSA
tara:strand:- start:86 stop:442 length:357 start_codon:yes stop_codon:yes gene_type:complete